MQAPQEALLTGAETPRYTFDVLYDIEKATVDTRRYRYGRQAQTRREVNGYKRSPVTLTEVYRFYTQKKQAIRLFGCAMSWL
jgi:PHS family inorganic phosphate transporter-like MFS transporter